MPDTRSATACSRPTPKAAEQTARPRSAKYSSTSRRSAPAPAIAFFMIRFPFSAATFHDLIRKAASFRWGLTHPPVALKHLLEISETVECKPGLTDFASGDLGFQERLEIWKRTIEFLRDTHHRAGLLDTFDRFVQDVDLSHWLQIRFRYF